MTIRWLVNGLNCFVSFRSDSINQDLFYGAFMKMQGGVIGFFLLQMFMQAA